MRKVIVFLFAVIVSYLLFLVNPKKTSFPSQLFIVCTTTIIADTVKQVGGEYISVKTLMGPGIDPHLYRAKESDVTALSNADLIFYNGLHLEGKMAQIFAHMNCYVPTVALAEAVPVKDRIASDFTAIYDPHVWHDVSLWRKVVTSIADSLSRQDPAHADYYQIRAKKYDARLQRLDTSVRKQISTIEKEQRILVTAHDAFAYFGRAYGIEVIGLQGISTDAQVSARDIQKTVEYIITHKIPAIFLESSIPCQSMQAVQRAVQATGWQVAIAPELFSDSLGDATTNASTYDDMIRYNVETVVSALTR